MPDSNGKLQLQDYDQQLVVRGFDAFQQVNRYQMINAGYRAIAAEVPWMWEETYKDYPLLPGQYTIPISGGAPLLPSSVETIVCVTDPYRKKLDAEQAYKFKERWLYLDLTVSQNQGITSKYYIWQSVIYVLPPPQFAMTFRVFFHQWLPDMVLITDVPDESPCHQHTPVRDR